MGLVLFLRRPGCGWEIWRRPSVVVSVAVACYSPLGFSRGTVGAAVFEFTCFNTERRRRGWLGGGAHSEGVLYVNFVLNARHRLVF